MIYVFIEIILVTPVGDLKLKILDSDALRRNVWKDKIVRTKALKSHEKIATGFGNFKANNDKNWTIYFGLLFFNTSYITQQAIL